MSGTLALPAARRPAGKASPPLKRCRPRCFQPRCICTRLSCDGACSASAQWDGSCHLNCSVLECIQAKLLSHSNVTCGACEESSLCIEAVPLVCVLREAYVARNLDIACGSVKAVMSCDARASNICKKRRKGSSLSNLKIISAASNKTFCRRTHTHLAQYSRRPRQR